jgi:dnd system-associated protein 4
MRGIRRSVVHEGLVRQLTEASPPLTRAIFPTMRELMCFAATLGFESDLRKPLQGDTLEVDGRIFGNYQPALDTLYLVALAADRSADILRDEKEDDMISIFEQYAEGGFQILGGWLREKPDDTNGDRAILAALTKHGFLSGLRTADEALLDVKF